MPALTDGRWTFCSFRAIGIPNLAYFLCFTFIGAVYFYVCQKLNLKWDLPNIKSSKSPTEIDENSLLVRLLKEVEKWISEGKFNPKKNHNLFENVGKKEKRTMLAILMGWITFICPSWTLKKLIIKIFSYLKELEHKKFKSSSIKIWFSKIKEIWRISNLRWVNL